jgi:hypothetical protein
MLDGYAIDPGDSMQTRRSKLADWLKCCAAIAASWCAAGAVAAANVTITFDAIDGLYPDSYSEAGFFISSLDPNGGHLHAGNGNLLLHSREGSSPYQIRRQDGGSFDFLGFDYTGGDSVFVSDTGASFTILGDQPLASFAMPAAFHDVSYINWYMNNPGEEGPFGEQWGTIDNILANVPAAPEPAQCAMLGLGLAALMLAKRVRDTA